MFGTTRRTLVIILLRGGVFFAMVLSIFFGMVGTVGAQKNTYPRLSNYYLAWQLTDADVTALAKWDVVILDMENQVTSPDKLKKLRELNPRITLLAYVTSQEIRDDAAIGTGQLRKKLASGIASEWFLYTTLHEKIHFFPGTSMLNMTPNCPTIGGKKWNGYLAEFVRNELQSSGLWDGVFYDNTWQDITWFTKNTADSDLDGKPDTGLDESWRAGYRFLFAETHRLAGPAFLVVGNMGPGHKQYRDDMNGAMFELFPQFGWPYAMSVYDYQSRGQGNRLLIINGSTPTSTQTDFRHMRFTLSSALLGDGYFSYDVGSRHGELWWYDEYGVDLGVAKTGPQAVGAPRQPFTDESAWKREFTNGLALVNPSRTTQKITLGEDFEKIAGKEDRSVNNGQVVDQVFISPFDGLILLKTFDVIKQGVFTNGSFVRFFDRDGYRARNGIFAADSTAPAKAKVYVGDMTGDGTEEKVLVEGPKVRIVTHEGAVLATIYPYGVAYRGEIELAVGRLFADKPFSIVVTPRTGGEVVVYSHIGEQIRRFFPFGNRYQGGFTPAIASLDGGKNGFLVLGTGVGRRGEVLIYANDLGKAIRRFAPYGEQYIGGVAVGAGNVTGDIKAEIVTYPELGNKRRLRIFSGEGKKLSDYAVRGVLGSFEARLAVADVNHDGTGEILFVSK